MRPRDSAFAILLLLFAFAFIMDIATGSVYVPPAAVLNLLLGKACVNANWSAIVLVFRLPKALCAALAGAGLAVSGLMLQTLFRNPLAGPSVLGITSGASLGVALVILGMGCNIRGASFLAGLGLGGNVLLVVASAIGAASVLLVILLLARHVESIMTLLIVGILGSFALSSGVSVMVHFSRPELVQTYLAWTFGSFSAVTWPQLKLFAPICLTLLLLSMLLGKPLNGLLLGESYARSMGINNRKIRLVLLALTALLVGTTTAFCGPVGFIGIAVPHLARAAIRTSDHRFLLPCTGLCGATVALVADLIAQLPGHTAVLPLNAVTALIGSPVIIWFILRKRNRIFV
ncbi:MAG: iron ABC transporter permease [Thermodesulfobacteria bacterium]|nr:iron ABC transporter permease [Thermodesulfobacteriota bacterium]